MFPFQILSVLLLVSLMGCASQPLGPNWSDQDVKGKKVIVFIPGLYGSALEEQESGDLIFQTLGQGLWGKIPLALSGDTLGIPKARKLKASGVLAYVPILPLLYSIDVYGGSVDYLKDEFGKRTRIVPFAYDWRQDDSLAVRDLGRQIRALKTAGASSIALVGHSLGAVLAAYYLRYGEQPAEGARETWEGTRYVDAVVLASGPYHGSMAAFHDLLRGTSVGWTSTPLAQESLGTFPSFFQFLPRSPKAFLKSDRTPLSEDFGDIENWKKWKGGLYHTDEKLEPEVWERRRQRTLLCLKLGRAFSEHMDAPPSAPASRRIPVLAIAGTGRLTSAKALWTGAKWHFADDILKEDGDGLVTSASATLPAAYTEQLDVTVWSKPMDHRGVLTDKEVQQRVTAFLVGLKF